MYNFREELIQEELPHPINAKLKPGTPRLHRTTSSRMLQRRIERKGGPIGKQLRAVYAAKEAGDEEAEKLAVKKIEILKSLGAKAKERANARDEERGLAGSGTKLHSVRWHIPRGDDGQLVYNKTHKKTTTREQNARIERAANEEERGYYGNRLTSRNPKKIRRDEGLRTMVNTPVPKAGYGEWAKVNIKEVYYFILDHLMVEGYADTYEDADAIFQIMSEEWFEDIILSEGKKGEQDIPYGRMMAKSNALADAGEGKRSAAIYIAANNPKGPKVKVRKKR